MHVNTRYQWFIGLCTLVEFMYLVFTRMPGESYRRLLRSLLLYLCYVFRVLTPLFVDQTHTHTLSLSLSHTHIHTHIHIYIHTHTACTDLFMPLMQMAKSLVMTPDSMVSMHTASSAWAKLASSVLLSSLARWARPLVHAKMEAADNHTQICHFSNNLAIPSAPTLPQ